MQCLLEVRTDFLYDIVLGSCSQAQDRRRFLSVVLGNVAGDVSIIGAEIVTPLGEAVCLVQNPRPDSAAGNYLAERPVSKLLRRHEYNSGIAETDLIQGVGTLRHGNQSVDGGDAGDALTAHCRHLVGH